MGFIFFRGTENELVWLFTQRDSEDLTQRYNGLPDDPIEAISRNGNVVNVYSLKNTV